MRAGSSSRGAAWRLRKPLRLCGRPPDNPGQNWKRREELQKKNANQEQHSVEEHAAQYSMCQRRVRWPVVGGPSKALLPFSLRDICWSNFLERHPRAIGLDATFSRNGTSQVQHVISSHQIN